MNGTLRDEWKVFVMADEETGAPMTAERIGEYVCKAVKKTAEESGSTAFLFVTVETPDGPRDVCHVGNGRNSPRNALLIAAAPDLLVALRDLLELIRADDLVPESVSYMHQARAAIAKAEGRTA